MAESWRVFQDAERSEDGDDPIMKRENSDDNAKAGVESDTHIYTHMLGIVLVFEITIRTF